MATPRPPLTYLDGIGTGVGAIAVAAALYLAVASQSLAEMYRVFDGVALPPGTRLVLHPAWAITMPLLLIGAFVVYHLRRRRFALPAFAVLAIGIDLFWFFAAWAPIHALAGGISG